MKKTLLLLIAILLIACFKDQSDGTEARLPDITTEGKNTFGCVIDEITFLPRRKTCLFCQDILKARYYHLENSYYGQEPGYYLFIDAYNQITKKGIKISLSTSEAPLVEGQFYPIVLKGNNKIDANYYYYTSTPDPDNSGVNYHTTHNYDTTDEINGLLEIIFLDEINNIISGVFHFDAINQVNGNIAEIKNGRFDLIYEPFPN